LRRYRWLCFPALLVACGSAATPTAPARSSAPTQTRLATLAQEAGPRGTAPAGWRVYRGTEVPFVIAYPPDWAVDETSASVGEITIRSNRQDGVTWGRVRVVGKPDRPATVEMLRDRYFQLLTRPCEGGRTVVSTSDESVSGIRFASLAAKCELDERDAVYYIGAGLAEGVEWDFAFLGGEADFAANRGAYFGPMLQTLNIYANP
jgi:hypothetical protein